MTAKQHIFKTRRHYNQLVANETMEDFALRFTAKKARRWSPAHVALTALGAISFLALEAIGGAITIQYGFTNAVWAVVAVSLVILLTAIPISYYAAKYGVDSDLLTRGAGFGYIGSTITSLIYASFTFIFFALEAVIMAMALELLFGIPLVFGYVICAIVIIPLVTHGITLISRFQLWTQPFWILLQLLPFGFIIWSDVQTVENWTQFEGTHVNASNEFNLLLFGAASAVMFALIAQIGEQVDFLRFVPEQQRSGKRAWWTAVMLGGPGWIVIGAVKILAGSFLAVLALNHGIPKAEASDPTQMYMIAFGYMTSSPQVALSLAGIFVILCQMKINVTNAYAGSIAWSNFFSRLTHSHPGRVVWLIFNVSIALLVMELGVYRAIEATLGYYGIIAVAWAGALVADLVINKPLGFSPKHIEFKRAHLYDINPVGVGAMLFATLIGTLCFTNVFGLVPQALAHFITLATALLTAPFIAWLTKGRYYLARNVIMIADAHDHTIQCCICENHFEPEDMTTCPAYAGNICSLCCSLDARCGDYCKPGAGYADQIRSALTFVLPIHWLPPIGSKVGHFLVLLFVINGITALMLSMIYQQANLLDTDTQTLLADILMKVFFILLIITGVISWLFVLTHESRRVAQEESNRQNYLLMEEIEAHELTDKALQQAKELAEAANLAKSRYLTGISHELRSPLNAVMGYAQLLQQDSEMPPERKNAIKVIRRSSEYLADLIEGLLDISKIEAGRLDLQQDVMRLDLLLDQLVQMFRLQAKEKGLYFNFSCPVLLPQYVKADEKRVRQILINLLSNAIKYTEKGGVNFTVKYSSGVAEFKIEDSGEGISLNNFDRIYMPFERIRRPGSKATGTGLGLTISKLLCEIMGGDIRFTSIPDEGSIFYVSLLLPSIQHQTTHTHNPMDIRIISFEGKPKKIIVIDDDETQSQLMCNILQPIGFDIVEIRNPLIAIEIINNTSPDLILLDLSMPGLNGWILLQQIRDLGIRIPVIIVSANADEDKAQALNIQQHLYNAYITKPIQITQLLDYIGILLNIKWIYKESSTLKITDIEANQNSISLPEKACTELIQLATIGHRKGILELLYSLKNSDIDHQTDYQGLILLAENFQFDDIINKLQVINCGSN